MVLLYCVTTIFQDLEEHKLSNSSYDCHCNKESLSLDNIKSIHAMKKKKLFFNPYKSINAMQAKNYLMTIEDRVASSKRAEDLIQQSLDLYKASYDRMITNWLPFRLEKKIKGNGLAIGQQ